ncbi:hypothetical protein KKD52_08985 [Myxococcota bacterium]|jgi:hypothetical protein|nr:hypothetical protein [Myxococcota bacterium]MBU1412483.1 hypothetical protein [Myxococcota bacterium]MBU1510481.1 hypothetical protein [Myxococcota bacterium]PKN21246.1 MAG: hypothetical protein CVU65_17255 [Deltaproteobacteria bacterium HGW-Deltaproteobacteria-22]
MTLMFRSAYLASVQAEHAQTSASNASSTANSALSKMEMMQADLERLLMITEAMWLIIKENNLVSDDELVAKIREVDLRDGRLDGRVAKQNNPECPGCKRTVIGKHPVCLYCGAVVDRDPFAR